MFTFWVDNPMKMRIFILSIDLLNCIYLFITKFGSGIVYSIINKLHFWEELYSEMLPQHFLKFSEGLPGVLMGVLAAWNIIIEWQALLQNFDLKSRKALSKSHIFGGALFLKSYIRNFWYWAGGILGWCTTSQTWNNRLTTTNFRKNIHLKPNTEKIHSI